MRSRKVSYWFYPKTTIEVVLRAPVLSLSAPLDNPGTKREFLLIILSSLYLCSRKTSPDLLIRHIIFSTYLFSRITLANFFLRFSFKLFFFSFKYLAGYIKISNFRVHYYFMSDKLNNINFGI